jgi:aldose 1-epimerase
MELMTMRIDTEQHGNWKLYKLVNDHEMEVHVLDYGGIVAKIIVPDKDGKLENVALGYEDLKDYERDPNLFGAIVGRVAGRIDGATFTLDGHTFELEKNEGPNHLHGGSHGFHQVIWKAEAFESEAHIGVKLSHFSPDGEGGYPGSLQVEVIYRLNNRNQLIVDYKANSDKLTALTLTNHTYFNLTGDLKETVHNHHVQIESDQFVELDDQLIPTGRILDVDQTSFDFRSGRLIADGIESGTEQNVIVGNGYDHFFVFNDKKKEKVIVKDESSGRKLIVETNQPGTVMYTSNGLTEGLPLTTGLSKKYLGVCFETQSSPASLHHESFPSVVLKADEEYRKHTVFTFGND